ncbi:MAG TPA: hypothetical protein VFU29_13120 [Chitinophagaceae bacterium]|nr:hypothetical protein [Chitinophagaceae bacterium]
MLPKRLIDILNEHDPEDIAISITKIDYETNNLNFIIKVSGFGYNDEENYEYRWTVNVIQYRTSKISLNFASSISISDNHPVLWQFSDKQSQLYFNGNCNDVDKLFLDLYRTHNICFEGLIDFEDTINQSDSLDHLLKSKNGLLATGPNKLMIMYADVLTKHNMNYSIIGDRVPTFWDGEKHVSETGKAKVMFMDNFYIVADDFDFVS